MRSSMRYTAPAGSRKDACAVLRSGSAAVIMRGLLALPENAVQQLAQIEGSAQERSIRGLIDERAGARIGIAKRPGGRDQKQREQHQQNLREQGDKGVGLFVGAHCG